MPTWVIQRVEALAMCDGRDISDGNEPLFIEHFTNENYFSASLHQGGIAGVSQDRDKQDDDNDDDDRNTNEDLNEPPGIALEHAAA